MKNKYIGFDIDCNETVDCVVEKKQVTILRTNIDQMNESYGT
jgi:hypothetical protein